MKVINSRQGGNTRALMWLGRDGVRWENSSPAAKINTKQTMGGTGFREESHTKLLPYDLLSFGLQAWRPGQQTGSGRRTLCRDQLCLMCEWHFKGQAQDPLVVKLLRLGTSNAGVACLIPGPGTSIPYVLATKIKWSAGAITVWVEFH